MRQGFGRFAAVAGAMALALVLGAGCTSWRSADYERQRETVDLVDALREEALKLPDAAPRERLVTGLIQVREQLVGEAMLKAGEPPSGEPALPSPTGGTRPSPTWATMFAPTSLVIGFFTRSKNFDNEPGDDGLEVRIQPLDQFGDPTKAVGSYRIEAYEYRLRTGEKRGGRLGHWFVSVLDAESNRKYYDPVDRSYVFPLLWNSPIEAGTAVLIQATYYPPGGFQEKLFAQRVIRVGSE